MRKVQNCNALTHKHTKDTIAFTFNEIKRLVGGIVHDSTNHGEELETRNKAKALIRAAELAD